MGVCVGREVGVCVWREGGREVGAMLRARSFYIESICFRSVRVWQAQYLLNSYLFYSNKITKKMIEL